MPAGDTLADPIVGAELRAEAQDERKNSLVVAAEKDAANARHPGAATTSQVDGDLLDEDFPSPTTEELMTLRRVPNKIPAKLFTIAFIELCERFSYYGSTVVCKSHRPQLRFSHTHNRNG